MKSNKPMVKLALASILATLSANSMAAFNSGSTGVDGPLEVTSSRTINLPPDGVLNYTTINISSGATLTFKRNAANTPVTILASGDVTIAGTIDVSGSAAQSSQPGAKGGPGGFDGGRGGAFIDASQWKASGEPTFNAGSPGFGPGGGHGGTVLKPGPTSLTANGDIPFLRQGTGGAYGSKMLAVPASASRCAQPEVLGYGNANLIPLVGGAGGGGGAGGNRVAGSGGGGGGGAILIASSGVINQTGTIRANGGETSGNSSSANGGGGSGGAVRLIANIIRGNGSIYATGGGQNPTNGSLPPISPGDTQFGICPSPDGAYAYTYGSPGRIRLEATIMERTAATSPQFTYDIPGPVVVPGGTPGLTIASIGGKPVPESPTGYGDLSFDEPGTQRVVINTSGVPVGSIVTLSVAQAGLATANKINSAPTTGTKASATTSVDVALTGGSNTVQASVTYTVGGQVAAALAPLAGKEQVAQVRLESVLGAGEQLATLITVSGKEYKVSAASIAGI